MPYRCNLAYRRSVGFGQKGVDEAMAVVTTEAGQFFATAAFPQELDMEFPDRPIGYPFRTGKRHCEPHRIAVVHVPVEVGFQGGDCMLRHQHPVVAREWGECEPAVWYIILRVVL